MLSAHVGPPWVIVHCPLTRRNSSVECPNGTNSECRKIGCQMCLSDSILVDTDKDKDKEDVPIDEDDDGSMTRFECEAPF